MEMMNGWMIGKVLTQQGEEKHLNCGLMRVQVENAPEEMARSSDTFRTDGFTMVPHRLLGRVVLLPKHPSNDDGKIMFRQADIIAVLTEKETQ